MNQTGKQAQGLRVLPRLDMTPMVDLGFLLITFFVLTTSFMKPKVMDLTLPSNDNKTHTEISRSRTLELYLSGKDSLHYFNPLLNEKPQWIDFQKSANLRIVFEDAKKAIGAKWGKSDTMVVLIKPSPYSNYKNLVDVFDEIQMNQIHNYCLMDYNTQKDDVFLNLRTMLND